MLLPDKTDNCFFRLLASRHQRRNLWKEKPGRSMRVRLPVILNAVKDNDKRTITTSVTWAVSGQISP